MKTSLCVTCQFKRDIRTARSCFLLCQLSNSNPAFAKYPPQPVRQCSGYQPISSDMLLEQDPPPDESLQKTDFS
jgi:hypothetical protein